MLARVLRVQSQTGGNLGSVLVGLADTIRDRRRLLRRVSAITAQGRATGWLLGLLPVALGAFLAVAEPTLRESMLFTPVGQLFLAARAGSRRTLDFHHHEDRADRSMTDVAPFVIAAHRRALDFPHRDFDDSVEERPQIADPKAGTHRRACFAAHRHHQPNRQRRAQIDAAEPPERGRVVRGDAGGPGPPGSWCVRHRHQRRRAAHHLPPQQRARRDDRRPHRADRLARPEHLPLARHQGPQGIDRARLPEFLDLLSTTGSGGPRRSMRR